MNLISKLVWLRYIMLGASNITAAIRQSYYELNKNITLILAKLIYTKLDACKVYANCITVFLLHLLTVAL